MVRVELAELLAGGGTEAGLKLSPKPPGADAVRPTAELKLSIEPTVMVEPADPPTAIVTGVPAVIEKSGTITVDEALAVLLSATGSSGEPLTLAIFMTRIPRAYPLFIVPL